MTLLTFHGRVETKKELIKELKAHRAADDFIQRTYHRREGGRFKGCAVGCTPHAGNASVAFVDVHREYETRYGIPTALARLEDLVFERFNKEDDYKTWPIIFVNALPVGADASTVLPTMALLLLDDRKTRKALTKRMLKPDEYKKLRERFKRVVAKKITREQFDAQATSAPFESYMGYDEGFGEKAQTFILRALNIVAEETLSGDSVDVEQWRGERLRDLYVRACEKLRPQRLTQNQKIESLMSAIDIDDAAFKRTPQKFRFMTLSEFRRAYVQYNA